MNHTLNFMNWMIYIQNIHYSNNEAMSRAIEILNINNTN